MKQKLVVTAEKKAYTQTRVGQKIKTEKYKVEKINIKHSSW